MKVQPNPAPSSDEDKWMVVDDPAKAPVHFAPSRTAARQFVADVKTLGDKPEVFEPDGEVAKTEHAALSAWARKPKSSRGDKPATPNLDAMLAADPSYAAKLRANGNGKTTTAKGTTSRSAVHSDRPDVSKTQLAISLRNAKHGTVIATGLGKLDGASVVGGDWLVVDKDEAPEVAQALEAARSGVPMFDGRVLIATTVALLAQAKTRKGEFATAAARAAVALNVAGPWVFEVRSDGQVEFSFGDRVSVTARKVLAILAPAEVDA